MALGLMAGAAEGFEVDQVGEGGMADAGEERRADGHFEIDDGEVEDGQGCEFRGRQDVGFPDEGDAEAAEDFGADFVLGDGEVGFVADHVDGFTFVAHGVLDFGDDVDGAESGVVLGGVFGFDVFRVADPVGFDAQMADEFDLVGGEDCGGEVFEEGCFADSWCEMAEELAGEIVEGDRAADGVAAHAFGAGDEAVPAFFLPHRRCCDDFEAEGGGEKVETIGFVDVVQWDVAVAAEFGVEV